MSKKQPDISIVIGSYNGGRFLSDTIASLHAHLGRISSEIIVVDDASSDGSVTQLAAKFPTIHSISNKQNLGYAKTYNKGTQIARGRYILHLNSDVTFLRSTLATQVGYMDKHPEVGLLGCKIVRTNGRLQLTCRRNLPTVENTFYHTLGLGRLFPQSQRFGNFYLTYKDQNMLSLVECLTGAFMLIRGTVFEEIGYLDERFTMYCEDTDFCYRAIHAGWDIVYNPQVVVSHIHGATTRHTKLRHIWRFHTSMRMYFEKHFSYHVLPIRILVQLTILLRFVVLAGGYITSKIVGRTP